MRRLVPVLLLVLALMGVGQIAFASEPPSEQPIVHTSERVAETYRPSRPAGFWTGTRPAKNGAYRWRLLAIGVGVVCVSTFFTVRFIRKQSRARVAAE